MQQRLEDMKETRRITIEAALSKAGLSVVDEDIDDMEFNDDFMKRIEIIDAIDAKFNPQIDALETAIARANINISLS